MELDPKGLNVRAGPSAKSKIIGKLAPSIIDSRKDRFALVEVSVIGSRNSWLLIDGAGDNELLMDGLKLRPSFRGKGWVSGRKIAVKTQAKQARLEPNVKSDTAFLVGNVLDGDSLSRPGQLIGCRGKWALLEYKLDKNDIELIDEIKINPAAKVSASPIRVRGWVNQLCDIQETSCSGLRDE